MTAVLMANIKEAGYSKEEPILKNIHFSIARGELVGLIGPNGAGKSSTIKSLLGIIDYFDGKIEMKDYAYIPERPIFYDGLTLWEHIHFLYSTLDVDEQIFYSQVNRLLQSFQMEEAAYRYPKSFSKGMQQKAMILLAFLQRSSVYIIDEPFIGLDPKVTKTLLELIQREKDRGAVILMSTHVLDTAEKICDRFLLLSNGTLIAQGTLADIRRRSQLPNGSLFICIMSCNEHEGGLKKGRIR